jgi:single-stranded-DNA-specific exonuclease
MKYRWSMAPWDESMARSLAREVGCSVALSRCLLNRGFLDADGAAAFLEPRLRQLADPGLLPDMAVAVERLVQARDRGERVVLFGDYDVDGVTATALLQEIMGALGWAVSSYLPSRFEEGYGLSLMAAGNCADQLQPQLLLAIDCGSTSVESIAWLNEAGIDVIVLDHHQLGSVLPAATALVNPRRAHTSEAPGVELCSAGLAFKLAHALVKEGRRMGWAEAADCDLRWVLDLAALGTMADLVPLRGENRILVAVGLGYLERTRRPGLQALKRVAGARNPPGVYEVAFQLAPRLNAAGRLDTASDALELLLTREAGRAEALARRLDERNRERQQLERGIADEAAKVVRTWFDPARDFVIVEGKAEWHVGVVGIVASRVLREFGRPTIILGGDGDEWRGSGRSIVGFDLASALGECREHLVRHGGHVMAAGLSLRPDQLEPFRRQLNAIAHARLQPADFEPVLQLDLELSLAEVNLGLIEELERLDPIGQGNPAVQVAVRDLSLVGGSRRMGGEAQHARFRVSDGTATAEAVWWNCGNRLMPSGRFDLAVTPQVNVYQGRTSVQLKVLDWQPADSSDSVTATGVEP